MTPQELIAIYPWMDHLMAETLLKAHANGTLAKYLEDWPEPEKKPMETHVIAGAVTVEAPAQKCVAEE